MQYETYRRGSIIWQINIPTWCLCWPYAICQWSKLSEWCDPDVAMSQICCTWFDTCGLEIEVGGRLSPTAAMPLIFVLWNRSEQHHRGFVGRSAWYRGARWHHSHVGAVPDPLRYFKRDSLWCFGHDVMMTSEETDAIEFGADVLMICWRRLLNVAVVYVERTVQCLVYARSDLCSDACPMAWHERYFW